MATAPDRITDINDEQEWHEFLIAGMEAAGWHTKHEVQCNQNRNRCDILAYHSELSESFQDGEWLGIEAKYSDRQPHSNRAVQAAKQIDDKYRDKTWLPAGIDVTCWAVAPYNWFSHCGPRRQKAMARTAEIASAEALNRLGVGYLFSWTPAPGIAFDTLQRPESPFPLERVEKTRHITTPGLPAFTSKSKLNPWKHGYYKGHELDEEAEYIKIKQSTPRFTLDFDRMNQARKKHSGFSDSSNTSGVAGDE